MVGQRFIRLALAPMSVTYELQYHHHVSLTGLLFHHYAQ
jgi:hypothetical protein